MGGLLRELRKAAGYRSVDAAAAVTGAPSSRQTIYAYERGGLTPSLVQFLDLVEFYVLRAPHLDGAKARGRPSRPGDRGRHAGVDAPPVPRGRRAGPGRADAAGRSEEAVILDIDHVGIAVDDLDAAVERIGERSASNRPTGNAWTIKASRRSCSRVGTSFIQLLGALGPDTPVGSFLAQRGPGLHHLAYRVDDVAAALSRLRDEGITTDRRSPATRFTGHADRVRPSEGHGRRPRRARPGRLTGSDVTPDRRDRVRAR